MITYTNIFKSVLDAFTALIRGEWTTLPIHYDAELQAREPQFINIDLVGDDFNEQFACGQTRTYTFNVSYLRRIGGDYQKHTHIDSLSEWSERFKRLIINNTAYESGGAYKWHDGTVESIEYIQDTIEGYSQVDLTITLTTTEVH